ncbi:hypothetical protein BDW69DRAFT_128853 [Aspergillus filifer]
MFTRSSDRGLRLCSQPSTGHSAFFFLLLYQGYMRKSLLLSGVLGFIVFVVNLATMISFSSPCNKYAGPQHSYILVEPCFRPEWGVGSEKQNLVFVLGSPAVMQR